MAVVKALMTVHYKNDAIDKGIWYFYGIKHNNWNYD